jgi:3-methyladenine DNA glycosylase AlkD
MAKPARARGVAEVVAAAVREYCIRKADPERVKKYARYFTEGYDAYGLDNKDPEWDASRIAWGERLRAAGPEVYLDAGDLLVRTGKYEEASFAILFARDAAERHTPYAFERIGRWFDGGIRNWGHTDVLCGEVLGKFLQRGVVGLEAIQAWRESPHKYQRRALPVSLISLLGETRDCRPLLAAVEPLMADRERVVQQGAGWFLREAWKRSPKPVEAFLLRWKDKGARLIFQYATEKMSKAERERFRRSK